MTLGLVTLVEPAVVHADDHHVVWHGGVIFGPTGVIVLNLEVAAHDAPAFRADPASRLGGPPPIDAHVEVAGRAGAIEGSFSSIRDKSAFRFAKWFQPIDREILTGAELHIVIHPLGLHCELTLTP